MTHCNNHGLAGVTDHDKLGDKRTIGSSKPTGTTVKGAFDDLVDHKALQKQHTGIDLSDHVDHGHPAVHHKNTSVHDKDLHPLKKHLDAAKHVSGATTTPLADVSTHPADHTLLHQSDVHKAVETSGHGTSPKKLGVHPNQLKHKIESAKSVTKAIPKHLGESPMLAKVKEELDKAKTQVVKLEAEYKAFEHKEHECKAAEHESKEAAEDAKKAAVKVAHVKEATKHGKATEKDVEKVVKEHEEKKHNAEKKAATHVSKEAEKKKAENKVDLAKKDAATHVDAATKLATAAAKTAKPTDASTAKAAAVHVKHAVGDMESHMVKTDCSFLEKTVLLSSLKSMPSVDKEYSCVGLGVIEDGEKASLGAIKCKPLMNGHCPMKFDAVNCKVVALDVGNIAFKAMP